MEVRVRVMVIDRVGVSVREPINPRYVLKIKRWAAGGHFDNPIEKFMQAVGFALWMGMGLGVGVGVELWVGLELGFGGL